MNNNIFWISRKSDFSRDMHDTENTAKNMKVLIAIIKPFLTEQIAEALAGIGIVGVTVSESKDFDQGKSHKEIYRGTEYVVPYEPTTKLEIITQDHRVDEAIALIQSINKQYDSPDYKIIVKNMDDTIRIRDGSHGDDTL